MELRATLRDPYTPFLGNYLQLRFPVLYAEDFLDQGPPLQLCLAPLPDGVLRPAPCRRAPYRLPLRSLGTLGLERIYVAGRRLPLLQQKITPASLLVIRARWVPFLRAWRVERLWVNGEEVPLQ